MERCALELLSGLCENKFLGGVVKVEMKCEKKERERERKRPKG